MSENINIEFKRINEKLQTDTSTIKSFGIEITSRYFNAIELSEMLRFTHMAKLLGVNNFIEKLFYDGQSNTCCISLIEVDSINCDINDKIHLCAKKTISQFEWGGCSECGDLDAETEIEKLRGMVGFLCYHANRLADCCEVLSATEIDASSRNDVISSIFNNSKILDDNIEFCLNSIPNEYLFSGEKHCIQSTSSEFNKH